MKGDNHLPGKKIILTIFGMGSSFILYAVPVIFKIADLTTTSVLTTFSHFIGSALWGLVLAQVLHWLTDKPRVEV